MTNTSQPTQINPVPQSGDSSTRELENQLHNQYAINNNSNATSLIAILSALAFGFAAYGYAVAKYYPHTCKEQTLMMLLASILVIELLVLLYVLSVNYGTAQRKEQFITFSIRFKRYTENPNNNNGNDYKDIYPNSYNPFCKNFCDFVQGIYNTLSYAMVIAVVFIVITTLYLCPQLCNNILFTSCWTVSLAYMLLYRLRKFCSYRSREDEYLKKFKDRSNLIIDLLSDSKGCCRKNCCRNWESQVFPYIMIVLAVILFFISQNISFDESATTVISILIFFCSIYTILIINDKQYE